MDERRDRPWYAVRCVFYFPAHDERPRHYEERITLWRASSLFDDAIARAEAEAVEHTDGLSGEYAGLAQCFQLAVSGDVGDTAEVFSLMRDSELDPAAYIDRFFDTGTERQGPVSD